MRAVGTLLIIAAWIISALFYHVYKSTIAFYPFLLATFITGVEVGMVVMRGYIDASIDDALELGSKINKAMEEMKRRRDAERKT